MGRVDGEGGRRGERKEDGCTRRGRAGGAWLMRGHVVYCERRVLRWLVVGRSVGEEVLGGNNVVGRDAR